MDTDIDIRRATPADAEAIVACFERCYAGSYPSDDFNDAERLRGALTRGDRQSIVAATPEAIVGHMANTVRHGSATIAELGNTVVDPEFRGRRLMGRLSSALRTLCIEQDYDGYVHYPTTAHPVMQKASVSGAGVEVGLMLGYIPAETEYEALDTTHTGRLAATIAYEPYRQPDAMRVCLPRRHRAFVERLYALTGLPRDVHQASDSASAQFTAEVVVDARRSLARLSIRGWTTDAETELDVRLRALDHAVVHADLMCDDPMIDASCESLTERGFQFCGLLPGFAGCDVLRLQRFAPDARIDWQPALANAGAQEILAYLGDTQTHQRTP